MQKLLADLDDAFREVPRPKITKSVARGLDDEWILSDERAQELASLDPEKDWHEVTESDVNTFQEYFNFSDVEGWRFYLPAFIRYYLLNLESPSSDAGDAVYLACTSPNPKFDLLSPAQMKCIKEFIDIIDET
ncbi:MAG TPA: DUF6714 family protein [Opitutaceae bacterium]|nr:DUF6714 family protein [Opitutaceae bacterium]